MLCIFCSHDTQELQTCASLLGSLLRQLVEDPTRGLSYSLKNAYEKAERSSSQARVGPLKLEKVMTLLYEELKNFSKIYIVVDALDECAETDRLGSNPRQQLLSSLKTLMESHELSVKVLLTTRPDPESQREYQWPLVELSAPNSDIERFLDQQLKNHTRIQKMNSESMIKEKITTSASGM